MFLSTTRERRKNAGQRMSNLINDEEDTEFYKNAYGGFDEVCLLLLLFSWFLFSIKKKSRNKKMKSFMLMKMKLKKIISTRILILMRMRIIMKLVMMKMTSV